MSLAIHNSISIRNDYLTLSLMQPILNFDFQVFGPHITWDFPFCNIESLAPYFLYGIKIGWKIKTDC